MVFHAFCLPTDIYRRRAGIRYKRSQIKAIAAIWNHCIWDQHGATTLNFWKSATVHAIAKYEASWNERAENSEESMTEDSDNIDSISETALPANQMQSNKLPKKSKILDLK
jgi:hypothetical protein